MIHMTKSLLVLAAMFCTSLYAQHIYPEVVNWTFHTQAPIYSDATIADDVVYVSSLDSTIYAVNATDGTQLWQYKTNHAIFTQPAISGNTICVAAGPELIALNNSGQLTWLFELYADDVAPQKDSWDIRHSSPLIDNGTVYVGTEGGKIYGVNLQSGEQTFAAQTENQSTIRTKPAVYKNQLFIGDWLGVVSVYDLETAELLWNYDTRNDNTYGWTNAVQNDFSFYEDDVFFAGRSCNAYCLDIHDGSRKWKFNEPNLWIVGGSVISDSLVYFGSSNQKLIYALHKDTGELVWKTGIDNRFWGNMLVLDKNLIFASSSVFALNKDSGDIISKLYFSPDSVHPGGMEILWNGSTSQGDPDGLANFHTSPVLYNNAVIMGCDDGCLYSFDVAKLLAIEEPQVGFTEEIESLGDLSTSEIKELNLHLKNIGVGKDLCDLSWSAGRVPKTAIQMTPQQAILESNDSLLVNIKIDAQQIEPRTYTLTIKATSNQAFQSHSVLQRMKFTVNTASGIEQSILPTDIYLAPNYPNPFNPRTTIAYYLPASGKITLDVCNIKGERVKTLVQNYQQAGRHAVDWDASQFASGPYFYTLSTDDQKRTGQMLLVK